MKQKLIKLKREREKSTLTAGDCNSPFSVMDRTSKQKISKDIEDLNNTVSQIDSHMHRTFHPTTAEYTFFTIAY